MLFFTVHHSIQTLFLKKTVIFMIMCSTPNLSNQYIKSSVENCSDPVNTTSLSFSFFWFLCYLRCIMLSPILCINLFTTTMFPTPTLQHTLEHCFNAKLSICDSELSSSNGRYPMILCTPYAESIGTLKMSIH